MTRHSKNSQSRAFFSTAERHKLDGVYGTLQHRISSESIRPYDHCFLCLARARDPLSCTKGHIACKECVYENILHQKKENARLQKQWEQQQAQREAAELAKKESEQQRKIMEFEKSLTGIASSESGKKADAKHDKSKHLPAYWLPSKTPDTGKSELQQDPSMGESPAKREILCAAGGEEHAISLKKLITVHFTPVKTVSRQHSESDSKDTTEEPGEITTRSVVNESNSSANTNVKTASSENMCPSCRNVLKQYSSNPPYLLAPCGHVLCHSCATKLVKPTKQCCVCQARVKKDKEIIPLQSTDGGSGYAAGGSKVVKKYTEAFQC